jgi:hypothetical protein
MSSPSRGIIYIATGQKFVEEACRSAASVKNCMPDISITIFSDVAQSPGLFDQVLHISSPTYGFEDKVINIAKSPYQETLYLDADTYLVDDSRELFTLLEKFDLAAAHAPYRADYQVKEVPDSFPEFNLGVILFRNSEQTKGLFERWAQIYREDRLKPQNFLFPKEESGDGLTDQPSFRRAIYESGLKIATLPSEYNCRLPFPGFLHTKVKIIHGRAHSFTKIAEELNKTLLPRVHIMRWGKLRTLESAMPPGNDIMARTRWSLHHRGILQTAVTTLMQFMTKLWKIFT